MRAVSSASSQGGMAARRGAECKILESDGSGVDRVYPSYLGLISHKLAMNLTAVMLGRNKYAAAFVVTKLERRLTSIGGPPFA